MWNDRTTLTGLYENNYCNRVGRKVYTDGREYTGELRYDLEHGKGVVTEPQKKRLVGIWQDGKVVEELFDSCAPEVDLKLEPCNDSASDEEFSRPMSLICSPRRNSATGGTMGRRMSGIGPRMRGLLPIFDESGEAVNGRAIITFLNGDKYVGNMKEGKKHGQGMYVYADLTMYKGMWKNDILEGVRHPVTEDQLPVKVKRLVRAADLEEKQPDSPSTPGTYSPTSPPMRPSRTPSGSRSDSPIRAEG